MKMVINGNGYQWKWLSMEMVINEDGYHLSMKMVINENGYQRR